MNHGSLFSGIGGFDLAAQWAGIPTIWQVENDKFCQKILAKHFPNAQRYLDIFDIKEGELEPVDIISGGFPCQPFSQAGRQKGKDDDRYLWPEMLRIITDIKPKYVICENVPGIINMALDQVLLDLGDKGYQTECYNIPACSLNAPHRRERIWVIAYSISKRSRQIRTYIESCKKGVEPDDTGQICKTNSNTSSTGRSGKEPDEINRCSRNNGRQATQIFPNPSEPGLEGEKSESQLSGREPGCSAECSQWAVEPNVGRVANGIPNRVDRLKSLGNAIVPQIAYQFFKAIINIESK